MVVLRALCILLLNLALLGLAPLRALTRARARRKIRWVSLEIEGTVRFFSPRQSLLRRMLRARNVTPYVTVRSIGRSLRAALELPEAKGFVVTMRRVRGGWSAVDALRGELERVSRAGRDVVVYLPEGGGLREIFVASAATRIVVAPGTTLAFGGLSVEPRYMKRALDRLGIEVEVHRRAEFKSAAEFVSRETMSPESRTQLSEMLETFYGTVVVAVAGSRGASEESIRALLDHPLLSPEEALEAGLIDAVAYEDELPLAISAESPPRLTPLSRAQRAAESKLFVSPRRRPRFALVRVEGTIVDSEKGRASLPRLREELRKARADPRVRGVLLHVDSPGGSALASDLLHRELVRLRETKPIVAHFADVSASGGYYLGVAAQEIVAGRLTITGSIGVLAARVAAVELLDRLGVRTEVVSTSPHADLFSPHRRSTAEEQALFESHVDAHYRVFVSKVAAGRGRPEQEIEPIARGRVYTGRAAHELGLVDTLGGLETAIERLIERAGISGEAADRVELVSLAGRRGSAPVPEPPRAVEGLARALGVGAAFEVVKLARTGESVLYYAPDLVTKLE